MVSLLSILRSATKKDNKMVKTTLPYVKMQIHVIHMHTYMHAHAIYIAMNSSLTGG